jgi:predicted transcriptional regulator
MSKRISLRLSDELAARVFALAEAREATVNQAILDLVQGFVSLPDVGAKAAPVVAQKAALAQTMAEKQRAMTALMAQAEADRQHDLMERRAK